MLDLFQKLLKPTIATFRFLIGSSKSRRVCLKAPYDDEWSASDSNLILFLSLLSLQKEARMALTFLKLPHAQKLEST